MRVRAGFTLFEVLAVMLIFGIVAATALPSVSAGIAKNRVQRAAAVISSDLRLAHSIAERQRAPVTIAVDASAKIVRVRDTKTSSTVYSERRLAGKQAFGPLTMTTSSATVVVYPNGLASGDLTIKVSAAGTSRSVRMTRAGLVRVTST